MSYLSAVQLDREPGDPTPKQISRECSKLRLRRSIVEPISNRKQALIRLLRRRPGTTVAEITSELRTTPQTVAKYLADLIARGMVEAREGSYPVGYSVAGVDIDAERMESADAILKRFRDHAVAHVNRARRPLAMAG
ncbi:MarR family transcriptional regulator [Stieleria sp. TO1_6]|uniref:MarR family transcriptional regulator n=1 Tax=Stieleria tagensis TaxID=2956795 RepID=UPI00209B371C|nr:helix-turn-helix domain-containing protein [Stieleria tagensis]MCO8124506.1 MarR family transcriptional regulator [Stieleria tagensis]